MADRGTRIPPAIGDVVRVKDSAQSERRGQEAVIEEIVRRKRGFGLKLRFADGWWGYYGPSEVDPL